MPVGFGVQSCFVVACSVDTCKLSSNAHVLLAELQFVVW